MRVSRTAALLFPALILALGLLTFWVARRPTPAGVIILAMVVGPLMVGLALWGLRHTYSPRRPLEPYRPEMRGFFWSRRGLGRVNGALALAFAPVLAVWAAWDLTSAATRGVIYGRHGWVSLAHDPSGFWFGVVIDSLCALAIYGLGGLALYSLATRNRSRRKLDAYLQKRADKGSHNSAIPPRLR
jgi:hypothetical protein